MPKDKKVSFSDKNAKIDEIVQQYQDSSSAIRFYFSLQNPKAYELFVGLSESELLEQCNKVLQENELALSLVLLSALEANFRVDYISRVERKLKDDLSRHFRELHKNHGNRVSLEDDILKGWKSYANTHQKLIGEIRSAFKYRHWLAHGRYWQPKLGQEYDFFKLQSLCESSLEQFNFYINNE